MAHLLLHSFGEPLGGGLGDWDILRYRRPMPLKAASLVRYIFRTCIIHGVFMSSRESALHGLSLFCNVGPASFCASGLCLLCRMEYCSSDKRTISMTMSDVVVESRLTPARPWDTAVKNLTLASQLGHMRLRCAERTDRCLLVSNMIHSSICANRATHMITTRGASYRSPYVIINVEAGKLANLVRFMKPCGNIQQRREELKLSATIALGLKVGRGEEGSRGHDCRCSFRTQ